MQIALNIFLVLLISSYKFCLTKYIFNCEIKKSVYQTEIGFFNNFINIMKSFDAQTA